MRPQCGCELGGDCTKTTLCAVNQVADDLEAMTAERDDFRTACNLALGCLQNDRYAKRVDNAIAELLNVLDQWGYPEP